MKKWNLNSWTKFPAKHLPVYQDKKELELFKKSKALKLEYTLENQQSLSIDINLNEFSEAFNKITQRLHINVPQYVRDEIEQKREKSLAAEFGRKKNPGYEPLSFYGNRASSWRAGRSAAAPAALAARSA